MTERGELWAMDVMGNMRAVPNTYEGIKDGLGGATMDFIHNEQLGFFLDDNGLIDGGVMNIPASMMIGIALYGPVVLTGPTPDADSDTMPPSDKIVKAMTGIAYAWRSVVEDAGRKHQPVELRADPDALPPAEIISFDSDEEFQAFLENNLRPFKEDEP